ncbi:hypothetical protein OJ963_37875 [Streptomyces sp. RS2]|uniref:hypothetical protein n=1 Tax=Streptomyces sp. RS2 TaxID=1451205 RepID=UPI0021F863DC|nr:hypothetical protein [Streptomyces sp. RS2]MCW1099575.1 hypothetical protein [Streptomyces sp. RS2]
MALLILAVSLVGGNDTSADSARPPLPAHPRHDRLVRPRPRPVRRDPSCPGRNRCAC